MGFCLVAQPWTYKWRPIETAQITPAHPSSYFMTGPLAQQLLSCADSFREDLTSRGLEENIYRV